MILKYIVLYSLIFNVLVEIYENVIYFFQMTSSEVLNPWNIQSIYDLQYFDCPSCEFKNHSKQRFVNHAFDSHPNSIEYLSLIHDGSFDDVVCPWDIIKMEDKVSVDLIEGPLELSEANDEKFQMDIIPSENSDFQNYESKEKCEVCNISFSKELYKCHLQTVHGYSKEFQCNYCYLTFKCIPSLKKHEKIVHDEKDISNEIIEDPLKAVDDTFKGRRCKKCDKVFESPDELKEHIKIYHKNFTCNVCNKSFTSKHL